MTNANRTPHLLDETDRSLLAAWRRGSLSARQFWTCYCRIPDALDCDQLGFTDAEADLLVDIIIEDIGNPWLAPNFSERLRVTMVK